MTITEKRGAGDVEVPLPQSEGFLSYNAHLKSRLKLPISRNEFEKLKAIGPTLEVEVLAFLSKNHQSAYTSNEIVHNLIPLTVVDPMNDPNVERVNVALENLLTRKAVLGKERETSTGSQYYFTVA
ncbi:MAG: hypothetical protein ABSE39_04210 [Candidatus Bathyarchaeia archaeon]